MLVVHGDTIHSDTGTKGQILSLLFACMELDIDMASRDTDRF